MPKANPKHRKTASPTQKMGVSTRSRKCDVDGCSLDGAHRLAYENLSEFFTKLKWSVAKPQKSRMKVSLCKKHYKEYHKLDKKDNKWEKMRDHSTGPKKKAEKGSFIDYD